MENKLLAGILFLFLLVTIAGATDIGEGPSIMVRNASDFSIYSKGVNIVNQVPDPAEPGGYVEVRFKVENIGTDEVKDAIFEIFPDYPFSLLPGDDGQRKLGAINGRQVGEKAYVLYFKLKVDKNAVDGNNPIKLRYSPDSGDTWILLEDFNVRTQTYDAIISVLEVKTSPAVVEPGKTINVSVVLKNMADSLLKDITLNLELLKHLTTTTTITEVEIPFTPIGSTNEKVIEQISPKETKEVKFTLIADPDAEEGTHKVRMTLKYSDMLAKNYTKLSLINLHVGSKPDITASIDSTTIQKSGTTGKVAIKFVNKGLGDLKLVYVTLKEGDGYTIYSPNSVYLGNIDSDDYETAEFEMYVDKTDEPTIKLPFVVEYKDANNNDYKDNVALALKLYSSKDIKRMEGNGGSSFVGFLIIVIIIAAGLIFYFRFWRKRKKKK